MRLPTIIHTEFLAFREENRVNTRRDWTEEESVERGAGNGKRIRQEKLVEYERTVLDQPNSRRYRLEGVREESAGNGVAGQSILDASSSRFSFSSSSSTRASAMDTGMLRSIQSSSS